MEMEKGDEEAFKGDEKTVKADEEALKGNRESRGFKRWQWKGFKKLWEYTKGRWGGV